MKLRIKYMHIELAEKFGSSEREEVIEVPEAARALNSVFQHLGIFA